MLNALDVTARAMVTLSVMSLKFEITGSDLHRSKIICVKIRMLCHVIYLLKSEA